MLRAQATNTKLKREFDFDRLEKQLNNWRQDYQEKEVRLFISRKLSLFCENFSDSSILLCFYLKAKASAVNEKLNALNRSRMERANTHSQVY